jgi:hypothetical protein
MTWGGDDSVRKEQFFRYFRQRLANLKQLALPPPPSQNPDPIPSFEPEQNILAGTEIDALAKYWAIYERRPAAPSAHHMAEFLLMHADARIWNKV